MTQWARGAATRYRIDADDRIIDIGGDWIAFAMNNGADGLDAAQVLGRPIWAFIAGDALQEIYALLFSAARRHHLTLNVPFRCDSADTRRFMDMTIAPRTNGELEITSTVRRSEARSAVKLLQERGTESAGVLLICSWCKRVQIESGAWMEVEAAVRCLGLLEDGPLPALSHGICARCRKAAMASARQ